MCGWLLCGLVHEQNSAEVGDSAMGTVSVISGHTDHSAGIRKQLLVFTHFCVKQWFSLCLTTWGQLKLNCLTLLWSRRGDLHDVKWLLWGGSKQLLMGSQQLPKSELWIMSQGSTWMLLQSVVFDWLCLISHSILITHTQTCRSSLPLIPCSPVDSGTCSRCWAWRASWVAQELQTRKPDWIKGDAYLDFKETTSTTFLKSNILNHTAFYTVNLWL